MKLFFFSEEHIVFCYIFSLKYETNIQVPTEEKKK